jgi:inorganic pyrophosphatase
LTKIDPTFSTFEDIDDVPEYLKQQLKHFIEHHKDLEEKKGKYVKIIGWRKRCCKTKDYRCNKKVQGIDGWIER